MIVAVVIVISLVGSLIAYKIETGFNKLVEAIKDIKPL